MESRSRGGGVEQLRVSMASWHSPTPTAPCLTPATCCQRRESRHGQYVTKSLKPWAFGDSCLALLPISYLSFFVLSLLGNGTDRDRQTQYWQHLGHIQGWQSKKTGLPAGREVEQWFQVFSSGPLVYVFLLLLKFCSCFEKSNFLDQPFIKL